jgi:hypothetical protein
MLRRALPLTAPILAACGDVETWQMTAIDDHGTVA